MPRALPPAVRKAIWNRSRAGKSATRIAVEFQVSPRTVRRLLYELRTRGEEALQAAYHVCGVRRSADERGMMPHEIQATIWCHVRGASN